MNHAVVSVSRRTKQKQKCRNALAEVSRFPHVHFSFLSPGERQHVGVAWRMQNLFNLVR
jgi:hypothetical protein